MKMIWSLPRDSVVRVIDLFAGHLDLETLGFTKTNAKNECQRFFYLQICANCEHVIA